MAHKKDIRMLVKVERSPYASSWGEDYFHITARPVVMEYDQQERETMPYGRFYTHEGDPNWDDLRITAQGDIRSGKVYGFRIAYYDQVAVTQHDAEKMLKALRPINRKMDRMERDLGYVQNFAEYLTRAGKAMDVAQYGFLPEDGSDRFHVSGQRYRWQAGSMVADEIERRVKALRERAGVTVEA